MITGQAYKVRLEIFEGPLDLLLYLIKRDEVDIHEVSIERITRQYLAYMDTFKMLNVDLAGEFIVMASNLMYIKSRSLLPRDVQPPEEDADEDDPRWELIRQLIEYKKFKEAAQYLQRREAEQKDYFANIPELPEMEPPPDPLGEVGIFDLIQAFRNVLNRFDNQDELSEIRDDRWTVTDKITHLRDRIPRGSSMRFSQLFADASSKVEVIVTFLAVLELMKINDLRARQSGLLGEIELLRT